MSIVGILLCIVIALVAWGLASLAAALKAQDLSVIIVVIAILICGGVYWLDSGRGGEEEVANAAAAAQTGTAAPTLAMVGKPDEDPETDPAPGEEPKTLREKAAAGIGKFAGEKVEGFLAGGDEESEDEVEGGEAPPAIVHPMGRTPDEGTEPTTSPVRTTEELIAAGEELAAAPAVPGEVKWYMEVGHRSVVILSWIVAIIAGILFFIVWLDANEEGAFLFIIAAFLSLQAGGGLYLFTPWVGVYMLPTWIGLLMLAGIVGFTALAFYDHKMWAAGTFGLAIAIMILTGYFPLVIIELISYNWWITGAVIAGHIVIAYFALLFGWWEKLEDLGEPVLDEKNSWVEHQGAVVQAQGRIPAKLVPAWETHAIDNERYDPPPHPKDHCRSILPDALFWEPVYLFRLFNDLIPTMVKMFLRNVMGGRFDKIIGEHKGNLADALGKE